MRFGVVVAAFTLMLGVAAFAHGDYDQVTVISGSAEARMRAQLQTPTNNAAVNGPAILTFLSHSDHEVRFANNASGGQNIDIGWRLGLYYSGTDVSVDYTYSSAWPDTHVWAAEINDELIVEGLPDLNNTTSSGDDLGGVYAEAETEAKLWSEGDYTIHAHLITVN